MRPLQKEPTFFDIKGFNVFLESRRKTAFVNVNKYELKTNSVSCRATLLMLRSLVRRTGCFNATRMKFRVSDDFHDALERVEAR